MRPHRRNTAHVKYPYIMESLERSKIPMFRLFGRRRGKTRGASEERASDERKVIFMAGEGQKRKKNWRPVPTDAPWKISIEDGVKVSRCPTVDPVIKKHFDEIVAFRGCGFFECPQISNLGGLTNVSHTVFYALFHCVATRFFFRRSKWWFMTKLHLL